MKEMSYNELIEVIREERVINLQDVSTLFKNLVNAEEDYEEYSYVNSIRKKLKVLARMIGDEEWTIHADENDYHNLAVDYARLNLYDCALEIIERGLKKDLSPDLLADKILYGSESGQRELCEQACERLIHLDKDSWGWRAYSFTIQYYLKKVKSLPKGKGRDRLKAQAYTLAEEFINYALLNPEDAADRAYFEKASLIKEIGFDREGGKHVTQESVLKEGCTAINPAPQCALCLADIMLERGKYDEAISYLEQCKLAVNSVQPSINPAYVYLLYAMAKTSRLIKETVDGDYSGKETVVESIYHDFHTATDGFDINNTYKDAADRIIKMLEIQTGFKDLSQTQSQAGDEFI